MVSETDALASAAIALASSAIALAISAEDTAASDEFLVYSAVDLAIFASSRTD